MIASMTLRLASWCEADGAEHDLFRQLLGFGFDHHHGVLGGGDDQVELARLALVEARMS
jgi:hypothetical protein